MRGRQLNLAARPFVNSRPVTRVTAALAALAALFLAADAVLFWRYFERGEDQREELRQVEEQIATERREVARLAGELVAIDLEQLNRRAEYLNHKIAERTFGWGLLFDRLAAILPGDVRLLSLTPRPIVERGSRRPNQPVADGEERVGIWASRSWAPPAATRRSSSCSTPCSPTPPSPRRTSPASPASRGR
jgi:hypothetical protein